jgi:putative membrane protein
MKAVLWLAKLVVLGFWAGAIYFTFFHPLPGKISTLIPAFAVLMLLVHSIQAALLTLIAKDLIKLTRWHYLSVLLFGFFTMLELRDQLFKAAQAKTAELQAGTKDKQQ